MSWDDFNLWVLKKIFEVYQPLHVHKIWGGFGPSFAFLYFLELKIDLIKKQNLA